MDLDALKAQWDTARQFTVEFRGATFHYRLPDAYEVRRVAREVKPSGPGDDDAWLVELFKRALVGWSGLTEDVLLAADGQVDRALVPFDPELAVAWAREDIEVWHALVDPVIVRVIARRKAAEDAQKN